MRAGEQVAESYRFLRGMKKGPAREAARDDLAALGVAGAADRLPQALSGGMAQRVAFAAARAGERTLSSPMSQLKGWTWRGAMR